MLLSMDPTCMLTYIAKALTHVIRPFCVDIEQVPSVALPMNEYPAPFSPEMTMIVIDHDTNIYIE